ncbi:MAG: hypothetical protein ACRBCI_09900 [Cellvibrionaceae bacterium]
MNNSIIKYVSLSVFSTLILVSCGSGGVGSNDFDDPVGNQTFSAGDLDVTRYVALGDSLTAGFKDRSLYLDGQLDSMPNILSQAFAEVGGGEFTQPLAKDNLGGLLLMGNPISSAPTRLVLVENPNYDPSSPVSQQFLPSNQSGTPTTEIGIPLTGAFNNLGVPGAKSFHLAAPSYGDVAGLLTTPATANPFFVYFASSTTTTVLSDALTQSPTFFTLWIGNNDILGYGTTGGDGSDPITPPANDMANSFPVNFEDTYNGIVGALTASGTNSVQGALINIPSITSIPFFTAIRYDIIYMSQAQADAANLAYTAYNNGLDTAVGLIANAAVFSQVEADSRKISFSAGFNPAVILDEGLTDLPAINGALSALLQWRQTTPNDFILLTAPVGQERVAGDPTTVAGVGSALNDDEVLLEAEAAEIEAARQAYNATILAAANANPNLVHVDVSTLLADVADSDGFNYGTGTVTSVFGTGGAFSLDGVHPTARGYAIVSNLVVDTLNDAFNAELPRTDPATYTETFFEFPAGFDFSP